MSFGLEDKAFNKSEKLLLLKIKRKLRFCKADCKYIKDEHGQIGYEFPKFTLVAKSATYGYLVSISYHAKGNDIVMYLNDTDKFYYFKWEDIKTPHEANEGYNVRKYDGTSEPFDGVTEWGDCLMWNFSIKHGKQISIEEIKKLIEEGGE